MLTWMLAEQIQSGLGTPAVVLAALALLILLSIRDSLKNRKRRADWQINDM